MQERDSFYVPGRSETSVRETAEDAVAHLDENIAALGRSGYTRGSVGVHMGRERQGIQNFKMYAEAVLGEPLEIHKPVEG